ncbi:MAG: hypothetical protein JW918_06225 [Anaerolineae bacterium]|nr:hypothetical protein [Anaerolineae bacterium]
MKKSRWFRLFLALGLGVGVLVILCAAPRAGLAEPAAPAAVLSPILGGWRTYRSDNVDNLASAVAYNSVRDEYLVVWEDHYASEIAIYARRVGSDGYEIGSAIQVAHYGTYTSCQPAVAYSPLHDKYLVVYAQDSKPSLPPYTDYNIIGQPINGDGTKTELGFNIGAKFPIHQRRPAVAYNPTYDEFLVTWDEEQGTGGWHDIWAQRVNAADWSFEPGPVCIANPSDSRHRYQPDVAYNAVRNEYLIAYTREDTDGDIFGKVVGAHLPDPLAVAETLIIYNYNLQGDVALAAGPDEYMAVWQDGPSVSWRTIYARRVTGAGTTPAPSFLIAEHTSEVCAGPDVAYGRGFGYLLTWSYEAPTSMDAYGRYVMPGHDAPAGVEFAIDLGLGAQIDPAVACAPSGDCLYVESDNSVSLDYEINGRTIKPYHVYLPLVLR